MAVALIAALVLLCGGCGTSRENISGGPTNNPITLLPQPTIDPTTATPSPSPTPTPSASAQPSLSPAPPTTATAPATSASHAVTPTGERTTTSAKPSSPHTPSPSASASASASPTPSPTATAPTTSQLEGALLTAADLGPDFSATDAGGGAIGDGGFGDCATLNSNPTGTTTSVPAAFLDSTSTTGLSVAEALMLVTPADVAGAMQAYAQLPTTCASFTATLSGLPFTFTAAPLIVTSHGMETTATRLTATTVYSGETISIYLDLVFILAGDTIIAVIVSNGDEPDINETLNASSDAYTAYTEAAATW